MESVLQKAETGVNRLLALDPEVLHDLGRYHGRRIAVVVTGTAWQFHITITGTGIELSSEAEGEPDVTIRGEPAEFMTFLRSIPDSRDASGTIEISGSVRLAQDIQAVFRRLDPDWEEFLSRWTGDGVARKFGNLVRGSGRFFRNAGETLRADISEYLVHEKNALPDASEVDEFNSEVDTLRNDAERLRARIERLQRTGKA